MFRDIRKKKNQISTEAAEQLLIQARLDFYSATIDNIILAPQDNETFIGIDSCDIIRL